MKTIALISLAWMLISPPASALTPVADGFNSNLIDPARWELAQFQNAKFKARQATRELLHLPEIRRG